MRSIICKSRRAQEQVVGFIFVFLIFLFTTSFGMIVVSPQIKKVINYREVENIKLQFIELESEIERIVSERDQVVYSFNYGFGVLSLNYSYLGIDNTINNSIGYVGVAEYPDVLPEVFIPVVFTNSTRLGTFGEAYGILFIRGSKSASQNQIEMRLTFRPTKDSSTGDCFGIRLSNSGNIVQGNGKHSIFIRWLSETNLNDSFYYPDCANNVTYQDVSVMFLD